MPDPNHPVDHFDVSRLAPVNESLNTICQLPPTPAGTNDPDDPPEPDDPEAPVDPVAADGAVGGGAAATLVRILVIVIFMLGRAKRLLARTISFLPPMTAFSTSVAGSRRLTETMYGFVEAPIRMATFVAGRD